MSRRNASTMTRSQRIDRCVDLFDWANAVADLLQSCSGSSTPPGDHTLTSAAGLLIDMNAELRGHFDAITKVQP